MVTRDDVGHDDGPIQPVHLRTAAHGHPPTVRLDEGIGRPNELDRLALDDRLRDVVEGRRCQEIQAILVVPGRVEIGLGDSVVRVDHEVLKRLTAGRHFHLVLVHVPLELIHVADVLIGRKLNLGLPVIGREFAHTLIEADGAVHVVRLEGQGPLHALIQLEGGRVAEDAAAVQFEEVGRQGGAAEPHRSGPRHAGIAEREGPVELALPLEHPDRNVLRADRQARFAGFKQNRHPFALCFRYRERSCRFGIGEHLRHALRAVRQQHEPIAFRMGRPKIQLSAALKAASIQRQVFIKRACTTVHRIAADRRFRAEPEVEVVHDPEPLGQRGQQIPRLQRPVEHQLLAAEGVEAIQGEGLHDKSEPVPLIGPAFDAGIIPIDIAGRLRDEHRVLRIEVAQPTRPVDWHVDPQHPFDVLELVPHPLLLRQSPGVPLLFVVDPELAFLHRIEFDGEGLIVKGVIRAVKLEVARPDGPGEIEITVRPDGHASIPWLDDDSAIAGHVHPRHPFQFEQAVEQADLPVGGGARFGAEEQHVVVPPACRIGQVREELVGRRGLPRPKVHLEVPLVRQHDHHGPGLRLGQPDGRGELLTAEGRVSRGPDVVVNPGNGVHRIDALHVPEDIAVEEILTEQNRRRAARARRPLQPQPILVHFPGQHIAIQRDLVVRVGERPRPQPLLGPDERKALTGQIESKVQFGVIDAVGSEAHNRLDPLPAKLLGLEDE